MAFHHSHLGSSFSLFTIQRECCVTKFGVPLVWFQVPSRCFLYMFFYRLLLLFCLLDLNNSPTTFDNTHQTYIDSLKNLSHEVKRLRKKTVRSLRRQIELMNV